MLRHKSPSRLISRLTACLTLFGALLSKRIAHPGVAIALLVVGSWAISMMAAFHFGAQSLSVWQRAAIVPWFTVLYTGLFVTGHDAMHGIIAPRHPRVNRALGSLVLFLYALIPYQKLYDAHLAHHQFPAQRRDPDFHSSHTRHPVLWYLKFMRTYWTVKQTIGLAIIYNGLHLAMGVPMASLLLFCAIPSLLSSLQLFFFGTYLVHRERPNTYDTPLCANSFYWPYLCSLLACYHFSYHREHHAFPDVPWWQLPQVSREQMGAYLAENTCSATATLNQAHSTTANHRYASGGKTLAKMSSPLPSRDRTRLNT